MARDPILIVDDNPQNLKLAKVILAAEGYDVRTAIDAEDALTILESFSPRLILMDLQLPRMDGLELTRRIKADPVRRQTIVLALTAYAMKGDDEKAFAAGCDGYISKPIDTDALARVVAGHLAARRPKRMTTGPSCRGRATDHCKMLRAWPAKLRCGRGRRRAGIWQWPEASSLTCRI